tara:strand:+ start:537 stop:1175 length:639 start_codon:yes stop_codon:yes gene_type:complete
MAIITVPADTGNGGGFSIAQGALVPTVASGTPIVTNMTTEHMLNKDYDSAGCTDIPGTHGHGWSGLSGETGSPFPFHTGHSNNYNSTDWPMYHAVKVSDHFRGTVVNRIFWSKHTNACGNTDIWGTMKQLGDHTGSSWHDTNNFTHLGRVHFGGSGSGSERGTLTRSFNTSKYGYRWILIQVHDNDSTVLTYPNRGNVGGWAMYGMQIGYIA